MDRFAQQSRSLVYCGREKSKRQNLRVWNVPVQTTRRTRREEKGKMSLSKNKESLFGSKGSTSGATSTAPKATATTAALSSNTSATSAGAGKTAGLTFKGVDSSSSQGPTMSLETRRKKIAEAREQSEKGMTALKTTLFQWKPDHLSAATYFERSADLYKVAGDLKNALLLNVQAAQSHEACGAMASTAVSDAAVTVDFSPFDRLCPADTPVDQLARCPVSVLDISRSALAFLLRTKRFQEALPLVRRMAQVFGAMEIEGSMCKCFLTETVAQLALGDTVAAQQTFLQQHLNNTAYMRSKECEVADLLILAFNNSDIDQLDKAKMHPHIAFLDREVQNVLRGLDLFAQWEGDGEDFSENVDSRPTAVTAAASEAARNKLFQSNKSKATDSPPPPPAAPSAANPPRPPLPSGEEPEHHDIEGLGETESQHEDVNLADDLDNLVIEAESEEEHEPEQEPEHEEHEHEEETTAAPPAPLAANPAVPLDEEDEELDLS
eukprot:scaffold413_cov176-Ochromonas_danica.AAC.16